MKKWTFKVCESLNGEYYILGHVSGFSKYDKNEAENKLSELNIRQTQLAEANALLAKMRQGLVAQKELWDMAKINLEACDESIGCVPFMAVHDPIILINSLIAEIDEVTK